MSAPDRLAAIKARGAVTEPFDPEDVEWLIAEVERRTDQLITIWRNGGWLASGLLGDLTVPGGWPEIDGLPVEIQRAARQAVDAAAARIRAAAGTRATDDEEGATPDQIREQAKSRAPNREAGPS